MWGAPQQLTSTFSHFKKEKTLGENIGKQKESQFKYFLFSRKKSHTLILHYLFLGIFAPDLIESAAIKDGARFLL
jgi:hypothetical protein